MEKLLTVRIDEQLRQKVKLSAVGQGTTIAEVVRTALMDYVQKYPPTKVKAKAAKATKATKTTKAAKTTKAKAAKPAKKTTKAKKATGSKAKKK